MRFLNKQTINKSIIFQLQINCNTQVAHQNGKCITILKQHLTDLYLIKKYYFCFKNIENFSILNNVEILPFDLDQTIIVCFFFFIQNSLETEPFSYVNCFWLGRRNNSNTNRIAEP